MKKIFILGLFLNFLIFGNIVYAEDIVYKCIDKKGDITYTNDKKLINSKCKKTDLTMLKKKEIELLNLGPAVPPLKLPKEIDVESLDNLNKKEN